MKTVIMTESFTKTARRAILYRLNRNNQYFFYRRYRLAPKQNLGADTLIQVLDDYFPGIVFFQGNNTGNISIAQYVVPNHGGWTLDIHAMSRAKEKLFSSLFPEKISRWNEAEARKRYGCADIIRFFIDTENDRFSAASKNRGKSISSRFFKELDYSGKPVWEDWDFSALVVHKMRHKPPSIYEAFDYYAHRLYTLLGFGSRLGTTDDELIKAGTKLLNDTIREQIPGTSNFGKDRLTAFFEMTQETLESVPAGTSKYAPTELQVFINQLKTKIADLYKKSGFQNEEEMYNAADRRTINNHIEKAIQNVTGAENLLELQKIQLSGTYREKINLLHRIVFSSPSPFPPDTYAQRELDIIHGLFLQQLRPWSLDMPLDGEDGDTFTGHDLIGCEQYVSPEDHFAWSSLFRDEFAEELGSNALEKFIECLPDHFFRHPFDIDAQGDLHISKHSRKILFSTFCSVAGVFKENELWKPFLVLLQRVVVKINNIRNM